MEITKNLIGKKVLIRSNEAGVYFGTLTETEGNIVRMKDVRNIWHWTGASCLSQIASQGITGDRVGPVVGEMVITNVSQIMPLTDAAIINLELQPEWIY